MQSNNPVFRNSEGFNGKAYQGYGDPATWSTGAGAAGAATATDYPVTHAEPSAGPMTVDSVVQKTGVTLGLVVLAAAATWVLTPDPVTSQSALQSLYVVSLVGAGVGLVLGLVNSFKRVVSPGLVLGYALFEGVFIGALSKTYATAFGGGVVPGAVVGTVAAFAGTLAAYKFFNIKVSDKFRRIVTAAGFGFLALILLDFVLSLFGNQIGINGFGPLGLVFSVLGLGLGVAFLMLDFDFVERGVAAQLPERESWRAAFGLTVTLIWIYINMLRILAILSRR